MAALHRLDDLIQQDEDWDLLWPWDIIDAGKIIGVAELDGQGIGYLLEPIVAGDIDADGDVDASDLILLLGAWGACPDGDNCEDCPADLDDDCAVGTGDLVILLGNWG